jgi:hypothetical protein
MKNVSEYDRHIFLYAKGHYEENDTIEDLKVILGNRANIDPRYININDIFIVLNSIVYEFLNETRFFEMITDIRRNINLYKIDTELAIIIAFLKILRFQKISNIPISLGTADSKILPIKKKK